MARRMARMNDGQHQNYIGKPKRLAEIFQHYSSPIYFVTAVTAGRESWLANRVIHDAFRSYGTKNAESGRVIGKYIIMPDHAHFFVRLTVEFKLGVFVKLLKQALAKALRLQGNNIRYLWQPGFFDHLLRSKESYAEKWLYMVENPVRGGLVSKSIDWPYQGEIVRLEP